MTAPQTARREREPVSEDARASRSLARAVQAADAILPNSANPSGDTTLEMLLWGWALGSPHGALLVFVVLVVLLVRLSSRGERERTE